MVDNRFKTIIPHGRVNDVWLDKVWLGDGGLLTVSMKSALCDAAGGISEATHQEIVVREKLRSMNVMMSDKLTREGLLFQTHQPITTVRGEKPERVYILQKL